MITKFQKNDELFTDIKQVSCEIFEHTEEGSFIMIKLSGKTEEGSQEEKYGQFFYEKIGLAILHFQPVAILVDMQELEYSWGNQMLWLFEAFSHLRIFGDEEIISSFVLSKKNRPGIYSLLALDVNPNEIFFMSYKKAYKYSLRKLEEL